MSRPELTDQEREARKQEAIELRAMIDEAKRQYAARQAEVKALLFSVERSAVSFLKTPTVVIDADLTNRVKDVLASAGLECLPDSSLVLQPASLNNCGVVLVGFHIFETDALGKELDPNRRFDRVTVRLFADTLRQVPTPEVQSLVAIDRTGRSRIIDATTIIPQPIDRLDFTASLAIALQNGTQ